MDVLPDVLQPGLLVVFCGTAVGIRSAHVGAYYAGRGNQFWEVLFRIGLTPRKLDPRDFRNLSQYRIGLTDLAKTRSGSDRTMLRSDFEVSAFISKIKGFSPKIIAFNGKMSAEVFFGHSVACGGPMHDKRIGETVVFVLPSTAASARGYWNESCWMALADFIRTYN